MCVLEFEMVAEKPLNFFHLTVEIQDVSDLHRPLAKMSLSWKSAD